MNKYLIIFLFSISSSQISDYSFSGTETSAMAGAVVSEEGNIWNVFHNPAGLTEINNTNLSAGSSNLYGYNWLSTYYINGTTKIPVIGKIAIAINQLETSTDGISLATEQTLSFANAYELQRDNNSHLSIGYSTNIIQWKLGKSSGLSGDGSDGIELGNIETITVDLGILSSLREKYRFGVFIKNINSGAIGKGMTRQILPRRINTGITYRPIKMLSTSIVSEYYLGKENMHIKGSMRYLFNPSIQIFAGAQSNPNRLGLGVQITLNKNLTNNYTFSYGLLTHPILPTTHQFSIGIIL